LQLIEQSKLARRHPNGVTRGLRKHDGSHPTLLPTASHSSNAEFVKIRMQKSDKKAAS
jgi:hypothetical protein